MKRRRNKTMDSNTAIVSPTHLSRYAENLQESSKHLLTDGKKLRDAVAAARVVWKDEKYVAFHRQLGECVDNLEKFGKKGIKYAEFLQEKAMLANRYLQRRD